MPAPKAKKVAKKKVVSRDTEDKGGMDDLAETLRSIKTKFGNEAIMTLDETKIAGYEVSFKYAALVIVNLDL